MNKRFSKLADLAAKTAAKDASFFTKVKALFRFIPAAYSGKYKANKKNLIISALIIAYIISPLDLIPDTILVFGWLDDVSIFLLGMKYLNKEIIDFMAWEKRTKENIIQVDVIEHKEH